MAVDAKRTFTSFPVLPTELRLAIWSLALHDPVHRVVIIDYTIDSHGIIRFKSRTRPLGPSALLYTCSESRDLALAIYRPFFGDVEFDPPFPKPLRGALANLASGFFKSPKISASRASSVAASSVKASTKGVLRGPCTYLDFSRDAIYFQQKPRGESVFDGVLRGMPAQQRKAIKVLGIDMDLCPMRRFEHFHHLLCGLDEWVLFARSGVGESRPPFANVQLSTVFFSEQKHIPESVSERLERQIQSAFERRRGEIEAKGGRVPRVKVEDHTNVQNQVAIVRRGSG